MQSTQEASASPVEAPTQVAKEPLDVYEEHGFDTDIANICRYLDHEPEQFMLSDRVREMMVTVQNLNTVEDFDQYNDATLNEFHSEILYTLPRVERHVLEFVSKINRARTTVIEQVDFI